MKPKILFALALVVVAKYALHSLFVPAYDGPDEPFHLARALAFSRDPFIAAFHGADLPYDLVDAVSNRPCGNDLARVFGCRPFPSPHSPFNILEHPKKTATRTLNFERNYENQQPPLYYAVAGFTLHALRVDMPDHALLVGRLLSVCFVAFALYGPLWRVARGRPPALAYLFLLVLLVPGAAEGLARASNDALLFLWAALLIAALLRNAPSPVLLALVLLGPLVKLTAFPVVAFAVVHLWRFGRRQVAVGCLVASSVVIPVQWARGWLHGVTYSYAAAPFGETLGQMCIGLLRSGWGLVKTAFWVGGWTAFRPPWELVAAVVMLVVVALILSPPVRFLSYPEHVLACCVAFLGTLFVAVGNRRFAGTWGGLCGWYLWGWAPWIALLFSDSTTTIRVPHTPFVIAAVLLVIASNAVWLSCALAAYG